MSITGVRSDHYRHRVGNYLHFYDLYKGEHEMLEKVVSDPNKPNNKLVNDFYGQTIDTIVGYFLGKPITVNIADDALNLEIDTILGDNDIDDLFMEVGKEMCIKGRSSILVYQNELSETKIVRVPAEDVVFVYDSGIKDIVKYAIRVYTVPAVQPDGKTKLIKYAEVYSNKDITYYKEINGIFSLDPNKSVNTVSHIFGVVPIIPFINNEEEMSDLYKIDTQRCNVKEVEFISEVRKKKYLD